MTTQLWFLLIDGTTFHAKAVVHDYSDFYQEQMKLLKKMKRELPKVHKACMKFINDNVFAEGEEEVLHPNEKEQRRFAERFDGEFMAAKAGEQMSQQKGKDKEDAPDPTDTSSESEGDPD